MSICIIEFLTGDIVIPTYPITPEYDRRWMKSKADEKLRSKSQHGFLTSYVGSLPYFTDRSEK